MKRNKLLSMLLVFVMGVSLCACGGSETEKETKLDESTNEVETETEAKIEVEEEIEAEDSGFEPSEPTKKEENKHEPKIDIDTENLEQYYDTTKFVGTPSLAYGIYYNMGDSAFFEVYTLEGKGYSSFEIEVNDKLTDSLKYYCISTDNNTPDDPYDDLLAFIFEKQVE